LTESQRLRPLSIGEILDRAVDLSVRNVTTLATIYLAFLLPSEIITALFFGPRVDLVQSALDAWSRHGAKVATAHLAHPSVWVHFFEVGLSLAGLYAKIALVVAVSATYLGANTSFAAAYRIALRRPLPLLGIGLLNFAFLMLAVMPAFLLWFALKASNFAPLLVAIASFACLVLVGLVIIATLVAQLAYCACLFEAANVVCAISTSVRRTLRDHRLPRSIVAATAYIAPTIAAIAFSLVTEHEFSSSSIQSNVTRAALRAFGFVASAILSASFATIFYYDARVRDEGLDLRA
jgi:hypothetical protein